MSIQKFLSEIEKFMTPELMADWAVAIGAGFAVYLVANYVRGMLRRRFEKLSNKFDGVEFLALVPQLFSGIRQWFFIALAILAIGEVAPLGGAQREIFRSAFVLLGLLQLGLLASRTIHFYMEEYRAHLEQEGATNRLGVLSILSLAARALLWGFILLLGLDNLGFDITALIAGLGIGGIAIGLAAQSILSDLFASLAIVLDKPFEVGDFVVTGEVSGTIESIGLKTTRVRALSGEQIVCSNNDLLGSRIHNYKRIQERRAVFMLGVEYGTPAKKLEKIPEIIEKIIEKQENTRFDRCHFKSYGDFSLNFETVFYTTVPGYKALMDAQQAINLEIYKAFEKQDIAFAFPTQTVHMLRAGD